MENDNGKLILQCMGCYECSEASCNASLITWDDLADAVNSASTIVDIHLDFLWEAIDHARIDGHNIVVTMDEIIGERKSRFLRLQDYWLAQHSLCGDSRAKEIIYSVHEPLVKKRLHYLGYASTLNRRNFEDLEQTIWLRTFRLLSGYNGQYRLWTWMKLLVRTEFHRSYAVYMPYCTSFFTRDKHFVQMANDDTIGLWNRVVSIESFCEDLRVVIERLKSADGIDESKIDPYLSNNRLE